MAQGRQDPLPESNLKGLDIPPLPPRVPLRQPPPPQQGSPGAPEGKRIQVCYNFLNKSFKIPTHYTVFVFLRQIIKQTYTFLLGRFVFITTVNVSRSTRLEKDAVKDEAIPRPLGAPGTAQF